MAKEPGDRYSVRIGGDAAGPVVVGDENVVSAGPVQHNTAKGHGTIYAVQDGDMHANEDG